MCHAIGWWPVHDVLDSRAYSLQRSYGSEGAFKNVNVKCTVQLLLKARPSVSFICHLFSDYSTTTTIDNTPNKKGGQAPRQKYFEKHVYIFHKVGMRAGKTMVQLKQWFTAYAHACGQQGPFEPLQVKHTHELHVKCCFFHTHLI